MREGMILVFGLPRSGTSWLGKIFDSHPETLYRHEPDKNLQIDGVPLLVPAAQLAERRSAVEAFLHRVLANRTSGVTNKLPTFPKSYRSSGRQLLRSGIALAAKALSPNLAGRVQVPDLIDPGHPGPRLIWKSISSAGRLGALARALPEACAILLLRHPCGQIASILRGHAAGKFGGSPLPSEQYRVLQALVESERGRAYGLTLDGLRHMRPVERMAWRWVLFLEQTLADIAGLPNCRVVRYEDLCGEPVEQARELFEFAGLDWQPQTQAFLWDSTDGDSDQYFAVRKDPRRSATKWRKELASEDARHILNVLARSPMGRLYPEEESVAAEWSFRKAALAPAEPVSGYLPLF